LYFVTPTDRARPAMVSALADFLIASWRTRRGLRNRWWARNHRTPRSLI